MQVGPLNSCAWFHQTYFIFICFICQGLVTGLVGLDFCGLKNKNNTPAFALVFHSDFTRCSNQHGELFSKPSANLGASYEEGQAHNTEKWQLIAHQHTLRRVTGSL